MANIASKLWNKWSEARAQDRAQAEAAQRQARERQAEVEAMTQRVAARFPSRSFPLIPSDVVAHYTKGDTPPPNLRETVDLWKPLFDRYPAPPRTDNDRKSREAEFWARALQRHIVKEDDGVEALEIKQNIIDYYRDDEKWILRRYYAATGTVRETWFGPKFIQVTREYLSARAEYNGMMDTSLTGKQTWDTRKATNRGIDQRYQEADRKYDAYFETLTPHMQEQGGWYFHNIEQAFANRQPDPNDRPSDEI